MPSVIQSFPGINPLAVLLLYVFIPPIIVLVTVKVIWSKYHWRGTWLNKFVSNLGVVLNHHAPLLTCVNMLAATLLFLNQGAYVLNNLRTSSDIKYYLRVDRPEFVNYNLIVNAQSLNSISAIRKQQSTFGQRRLAATTDDSDDATGEDTNLLSLIYHRPDWSDVTEEQQLINICQTERSILQNIDCLDTSFDYTYRSFITKYMNTSTCDFLHSWEDTRSQIGYFPNSQYFSDRTMYSSDFSPILISYLRMGSCGNNFRVNEFYERLNSYAVGDTVVVPASFDFIAQDLRRATHDTQKVMFYSSLFAYLFLIFSVRGIVVATATLFCVALSILNGAALLTQFGYSAISAFDVASLLVLLSVGCGFVHLYGAAWRRTVKRGKNASAQCLMVIFGTVGKGNFLTFLACCLAFFALGSAPVIFMSQMGYFIGVSMLVFFLSFHYLLVPLWVWTSWYTIPQRYHNHWRIFRQTYCMCLLSKHHTVVHHTHHHHHHHDNRGAILSEHGHSADEADDAIIDGSDDGSIDSESTVSVAVVAADQVRFASEAEGKTAEALAVEATPAQGAYDEYGNYVEHPYEEVGEEVEGEDEDPEEGERPSAGSAGARPARTNRWANPGAQANAAAGTEQAGAVTTTAERADDDTVDGGDDEFRCTRVYLCSGKRPVKLASLLALLATLFLILLCAVDGSRKMDTNFAYAQLINGQTNLQRLLQIFQFYRGDLFYAVDDDSAVTISLPFRGSYRPTIMPTARPTVAGNPTNAPTARPSFSFKPTVAATTRPTQRPTAMPTTQAGDTAYVYTDFRITGCWGLAGSKESYDSGISPRFDYYGFQNYMEKTNTGILGDMKSVCNYVNSNRGYLNVHPDWNRSTDCIDEQVQRYYDSNIFHVYNRTKTMANAIMFWGLNQEPAASMVGLLSNETDLATIPVWVCANFSGRTYLSTFHDDMELGTEMRQRWENAFYKHGNAYAKQSGVPVVVGSTEFTFPLLGMYITSQVQYQAIIFIFCFPVLMWLFLEFDYGLTLFGVVGLFTIYLLTIYIGLFQISSLINLGDVVVLVVLLPYMVCFNIHLITSYMSNRTLDFRKTGRVVPRIEFLSPALIKTQRYMLKALTGPLILAIIASVAFTWSQYPMLRRFGRYYLLCACVAYAFSVTIQPFLLAFSCKCSVCTFDDVPDEDQEVPAPPPPPPSRPPPNNARTIEMAPRRTGAPSAQRQLPRRGPRGNEEPPAGNNFSRHGSQFAMGSVYNNNSQFQMNNDGRGVNLRDTRPTATTATRSVATRSVASGAGSVASRSDMYAQQQLEDSDSDQGNDMMPYDSMLPANAVHLGTQQYVVMEQPPAPQPMPQGYDYVAGDDYGQYAGQQPQYDAYGRPMQGVPVQQAPAPQPNASYGRYPSQYQPAPQPVYQPPPQPVYQPAPQSVYQPPPQPVYQPAPQPVYQPAPRTAYQPAPRPVYQPAPQPAYQPALAPQQSYYPPQQGQGGDYESSVHRQMFLPPGRGPAPANPGAAPSFYSNGRAAAAPRPQGRQQGYAAPQPAPGRPYQPGQQMGRQPSAYPSPPQGQGQGQYYPPGYNR